MNKQSKDGNISWTDYTWNPIKGLCPVGCWYCYARKMYLPGFYSNKTPFNNPEIRLDKETFGKCMGEPLKPNIKLDMEFDSVKPRSKIFICSTIEIFHPQVLKEWRDAIFEFIEYNSTYTFQILTKMPENIDRPMPDNVWLGYTVTGDKDVPRIKELLTKKAKIRFVSIEPFLKPIYGSTEKYLRQVDWIILGRLTGYGKKHDPRRFRILIECVKIFAQVNNIPIFLKNNLKEIWGEELIQEFPE